MSAWLLLALLAEAPAPTAAPPSVVHEELKNEAKARVQNIEQMLSDWDVPGARQELGELEKAVPPASELVHYYRGRVAFEEGGYDEAVKEFEAAQVSDKPNTVLRLAKDTQRVLSGHEVIESAHFSFSFPKGKDAILAPYALETLEAIRAALLKDLGWASDKRVRVEVVNNAKELAKITTLTLEQIQTTGTIAICKFDKLMVTSPKATAEGYDWLDTLAHEYTHFVVAHRSKNSVPIWMHEGLAKFLESRWRGAGGQAMTPSTLALLGSRVRKNKLVPFEKMHPSMAMLPSAEDAATAFAEVFFAIDLIHQERGTAGLQTLLVETGAGKSDKQAVEIATGTKWATFERNWMAHLRKQPFPRELIPLSSNEKKELTEGNKKQEKKGREISFGDFVEVQEPEVRKLAHLGELMRERKRMPAAAEHYGRAVAQVGNRYESISNKYALTLIELKRYDEAEKVLRASLQTHPGSAGTNVHLGRIAVQQKQWVKARDAYTGALAVDPFDPEVHLALFLAHQAAGEKDKAKREQDAAAVLLKVGADEVVEVAKRWSQGGDEATR